MSIILNIIKLDGSVLKISTMELPLAVSCYHLINIGSIILQKINLFFFFSEMENFLSRPAIKMTF